MAINLRKGLPSHAHIAAGSKDVQMAAKDLKMAAANRNSKDAQQNNSSGTQSSITHSAVLVLPLANGRRFRFHLQCKISEQIHIAQKLNTHPALTQFTRSTPHSANSKRSVLSWQAEAVKETKKMSYHHA